MCITRTVANILFGKIQSNLQNGNKWNVMPIRWNAVKMLSMHWSSIWTRKITTKNGVFFSLFKFVTFLSSFNGKNQQKINILEQLCNFTLFTQFIWVLLWIRAEMLHTQIEIDDFVSCHFSLSYFLLLPISLWIFFALRIAVGKGINKIADGCFCTQNGQIRSNCVYTFYHIVAKIVQFPWNEAKTIRCGTHIPLKFTPSTTTTTTNVDDEVGKNSSMKWLLKWIICTVFRIKFYGFRWKLWNLWNLNRYSEKIHTYKSLA